MVARSAEGFPPTDPDHLLTDTSLLRFCNSVGPTSAALLGSWSVTSLSTATWAWYNLIIGVVE